MDAIVARVFDVDFIYFDLLFCLIWIIALVKKKYYKELLFGLFGFIVVFIVDDILWFHMQGTRTISAPINPNLFLLYFSFTYGMIEFSYVTVMFREEKTVDKIYWTLFLYGGWMISAFLSQLIDIDNRVIDVSRDMTNARTGQLVMFLGGYLLLVILRFLWVELKTLTWMDILELYFIGFLVHFGMEFSLLVSGIRPFDGLIGVLLFNSFIEFNTGIPIIFMLWTFFKARYSSKVKVDPYEEINTQKQDPQSTVSPKIIIE